MCLLRRNNNIRVHVCRDSACTPRRLHEKLQKALVCACTQQRDSGLEIAHTPPTGQVWVLQHRYVNRRAIHANHMECEGTNEYLYTTHGTAQDFDEVSRPKRAYLCRDPHRQTGVCQLGCVWWCGVWGGWANFLANSRRSGNSTSPAVRYYRTVSRALLPRTTPPQA
jgi:hypothetical protein